MLTKTHELEQETTATTTTAGQPALLQEHICQLHRELEAQRLLTQQAQALQRQQEAVLQQEIGKRMLAEQALAQTRQMADTALQMKAEFLASISHEIRTPLNGMLGAAELLQELATHSDQREIAGILYRSTTNLRNFLDEVLDFSKLEADKVELIHQSFDLHQCVDDVIELMSANAENKQVELIHYISAETPRLMVGDGIRLRQVLVNLLSNAIKFTETGEVVVTIQTKAVTQPPGQSTASYQLLFMIQDTGIGLSTEQIARLFQPYQQAEPMTAVTYGGTGLGLSICRRLVELMGGTIWVESQVGHGSNFQFTISLQAPTPQKEVIATPPLAVLQNKRVLIIEDSQTTRNWLVHYTSQWGLQPIVATSEMEVRQALSTGDTFDLTLLNLQVRSMDGATMARLIRRHLPNCPLVLLTTLRWSTLARQFEAAIVTKPLKPTTLRNQLVQLFDSSALATHKPSQSSQAITLDSMHIAPPRMAEEYPLRILLAEDNIINRRLAVRLLERLGYRVDVAGDGGEVVAATRLKEYDVILMDVEMPNMNGIEATHSILQQGREKKLYIVALTAHALSHDRQRYLAQGMDDYIRKPFQLTDLAEALRRAFQRLNAH